MAKELHNLPLVSLEGGIAGGDFVLVKKTVDGVPLDFKVDINTMFSGYLKDSDVGLGIGDLFKLVDDGIGNPGLPVISGKLLTNLNIPQASASVEGASKLSDAINGTEGVTNGVSATPKAVADLNNISFKKAGGEFTGAVTLPNNVPLIMKANSNNPMNVLTLDTNNDLLMGNTTFAPDEIKIYNSNEFGIYDAAGNKKFAFKADGTSTGINSTHITSAGLATVGSGTVFTQLQALSSEKLNRAGGTMTGDITMTNTIGIKGVKTNAAVIDLLDINFADEVIIGDDDSAKTIIKGGAGGISFATNGTTRVTILADGTTSGIKSNNIAFPTGTGGVVASEVQAALSWLGSNKLGTAGGTMSGLLTLNNNIGVANKETGGTSRTSVFMNTSNELVYGSVTNVNLQRSNEFKWYNNVGGLRLSMSNTGPLLGDGLQASEVNVTTSGLVNEGKVQAALYGLETRKLPLAGGSMSGALTLNNTISLSGKESAGAVKTIASIDAANKVLIGSTTNVLVVNATGITLSATTNVTGDIVATGNITGTSDIRVKTNIQPIEGALAKVRRIGGQTFDRTDVDMPNQMGVIAQVVEEEFPQAVLTDEDGNKSVAYGNLATGGGFAAIDELAGIVETQERELAELSVAFDVQSDELSTLKEMVSALLEK